MRNILLGYFFLQSPGMFANEFFMRSIQYTTAHGVFCYNTINIKFSVQ